MTPKFTRKRILETLRIEIADCLAIEPEEVQPQATFFNELGGESIDLLDITLRMQKKCGVRAPFQELVQGLTYDEHGRLSADTLHKLNTDFPLVNWSIRLDAMLGSSPRDLLTVDLIGELLYISQLSNAAGAGAEDASTVVGSDLVRSCEA